MNAAVRWVETEPGMDAHAFIGGRFLAIKDMTDFGGPRVLSVFIEEEEQGRRIEATGRHGDDIADRDHGGALSIYDLNEVRQCRSFAAAKRWAEKNYAGVEL